MNTQCRILTVCLVALGAGHLAAASADRWQASIAFVIDRDRFTLNTDPLGLNTLLQAAYPGYLDGFVLEDDSGLIGGRTGNWGFNEQAQVTDRPGYVRYRTVNGIDPAAAPAAVRRTLSRDGLSIGLRRHLDRANKWALGVDFYYSRDRGAIDHSGFYATTGLIVDHSLGGVTPPTPPYAGRYEQSPGMPRLIYTPETMPYAGGPPVAQGWHAFISNRILDFTLAASRRLHLHERLELVVRGGLGVELNRITVTVNELSEYAGSVLRARNMSYQRRSERDYYSFLGAELDFVLNADRDWRLFAAGDHRWGREDRDYLGMLHRDKTNWRFRLGVKRAF
jgi:hypothetical protein